MLSCLNIRWQSKRSKKQFRFISVNDDLYVEKESKSAILMFLRSNLAPDANTLYYFYNKQKTAFILSLVNLRLTQPSL